MKKRKTAKPTGTQLAKIAARIRALLAKAGCNGATREEADAALKKARELVDKYGLEMSDLSANAFDMTPEETAFWDTQHVHVASELIESHDVLEDFARDWRKVMAGEERNAKLLYLAATSINKCIHCAIKGPSSAGKSEIRKRVLAFIPDEDVISFTSLSEKALYYWDDDFPHKILSMGEAAGTEEQTFQDYLLRELMSEGILRYSRPMPVPGAGFVTKTLVKNGPVAFMVTTTKAALHAENETRMLSMEVDDSPEQTKRVLRRVALNIGMNADTNAIDYGRWHAFQRWLADGPRDVIVPYAEVLGGDLIPPSAIRLRRDFAQVLLAIKAHALIHRRHRTVDENGNIVADIDRDYRAVFDIISNLVSEAAGTTIKKEVQQTIDAVRIETINLAHDDGATAFSVSRRLNLDKSAARRRLLVAGSEGYVVNLETRRGQPGRWRVVPDQSEVETEGLLPTPETLSAYLSRLRPVLSCHPDRKGKPDQDDGGGNPGGNGPCHRSACHRSDAEENLVANATPPDLPPVKPLGGNGKDGPVAGWHGWQEGAGTHSRASKTHPLNPWADLDIPPELDRRKGGEA